MLKRPAIIAYVPPPEFGCARSFYENLRTFPTKHDLVIYSEYDWPGAIRLKASPEQIRGATYKNGELNTWAVNNLVFVTGLRIAVSKGFTHFIYLESDCRVMGDYWDATVFEEFFAAGEGKLIGGSIVTYNPCNRQEGCLSFARRWRDFVCYNANSPFPIPAYGGTGAKEAHEPAVLANGALGVYDVAFAKSVIDIDHCGTEAARITAWDYELGRALVRQLGDEAFSAVVHLSSVYSGYGELMTTEAQRIKLLTDGHVVGVHQVKSSWFPRKILVPDCGSNSPVASGARLVQAEAVGANEAPTVASAMGEASSESDASGPVANPATLVKEVVRDAAKQIVDRAMGQHNMADRSVSIFIVTYAKDIEWLKHCLRSIAMFATGFLRVNVIVPRQDWDKFAGPVDKEFVGDQPVCWHLYDQGDAHGYLFQQVVKCSADHYDEEASWFLFMDSDCIFTEPVTPADYFVNGKPLLLVVSYEKLKQMKDQRAVWQAPTAKALKFRVAWETMCWHPAVHYRGLLQEARQLVYDNHKMPFHEYVVAQTPPLSGFSEFNVLGSFALEKWPDAYTVIDVGEKPYPKAKLLQFWSHGGLERPIDHGEHKGKKPIDVISEILK